VVDSRGNMFGHLVAGDLKNNVGYIIPATQTFEDMKRRLGDDLSTVQPQLNMSAAPLAPQASPSEHVSNLSHSETSGLGIELRAIPAANFSLQDEGRPGQSWPSTRGYFASFDSIESVHGARRSSVNKSNGILGWLLWDNPMTTETNPVRYLHSRETVSHWQ